jgi:hypothetical protein
LLLKLEKKESVLVGLVGRLYPVSFFPSLFLTYLLIFNKRK